MSPPPAKDKVSPFQWFKCTKHKLTFDNIEEYKIHNLNQHPGKYTCKDCGKAYQSNHHLNQHVASIHLGMPYTCDVQGFAKFFSTSAGKDIHMLSHRSAPVYKCNICSLAFDSKKELTSHKMSHSKRQAWECDWCGLLCTHKSDVKRHKNFHCPNRDDHQVDSSSQSDMSCADSGSSVGKSVKNDKWVVTGHTKIKIEKKALLKFTCSLCHLCFKEHSETSHHMKLVHKWHMLYTCLDCSFTFCSRQMLYEHKKGSQCKRAVKE